MTTPSLKSMPDNLSFRKSMPPNVSLCLILAAVVAALRDNLSVRLPDPDAMSELIFTRR